jgi:hypothetical protein
LGPVADDRDRQRNGDPDHDPEPRGDDVLGDFLVARDAAPAEEPEPQHRKGAGDRMQPAQMRAVGDVPTRLLAPDPAAWQHEQERRDDDEGATADEQVERNRQVVALTERVRQHRHGLDSSVMLGDPATVTILSGFAPTGLQEVISRTG